MQSKYVSQFRAMMKREKVRKVGISPVINDNPEVEVVEVVKQETVASPIEKIDYAKLAQQNL